MKIFFSYPHDNNAELVKRIKKDLEARGHKVWFDEEQIKTGDAWRDRITRGILDSQQVVAFLSKHSVRDPGVCLNEIAIALADKGEAMVTVLVEPEKEVSTPVSITHIQWLRMEDWATQLADEGWYRTRFDKLVDAIEHPGNAGRHEELETLRLALDPMSFYAEIAPHIPDFTGRKWIINRYQQWLAEDSKSRVLRIEGGPGLGKTAVSSYLAHSTKSSVLAVHLCQYNKGESRNPLRFVRTLAYQLATRLPDYRAKLLKSVAIQRPDTMQGKDAASLWSDLISSPLAGSGDKGVIDRQRLAIIVDGLDEATVEGKNPIVELLASEINQLPKWIGVVLTGRPDPELTQRLARFQPLVLRDDDPANLADLKDYCDQWLAAEVKAGTLSQAQATAASQTLLKHSHGAFLYLSQARIAVAEGMLDLTQPSSFPSGLSEIYQRFFERRFPDTNHYEKRVLPLIEIMLAAFEPLPEKTAQAVLGWKRRDWDEAILILGSLFPLREGRLYFFHKSLRDWLPDRDRAGDYRAYAEDGNDTLTEALWQQYQQGSDKLDDYGLTYIVDHLFLACEYEKVLHCCREGTVFKRRWVYPSSWVSLSQIRESAMTLLDRFPQGRRYSHAEHLSESFGNIAMTYVEKAYSYEQPWHLTAERLRRTSDAAFAEYRDCMYSFLYPSTMAAIYAIEAINGRGLNTDFVESIPSRFGKVRQWHYFLSGASMELGLSGYLEDMALGLYDAWNELQECCARDKPNNPICVTRA